LHPALDIALVSLALSQAFSHPGLCRGSTRALYAVGYALCRKQLFLTQHNAGEVAQRRYDSRLPTSLFALVITVFNYVTHMFSPSWSSNSNNGQTTHKSLARVLRRNDIVIIENLILTILRDKK
jgi:hypothetical protein